MKKLPPHQNVIQLLGCVTKTGIKSGDVQKCPYDNVSNNRYVFWGSTFHGTYIGQIHITFVLQIAGKEIRN